MDGVERLDGVGRAAAWERAAWFFLFVFVTADLVSISVAQLAVVGMTIALGGVYYFRKEKPVATGLEWPVGLFLFFSLLAAITSLDAIESVKDSKDLVHVVIIFVTADLIRRSPQRGVFALKLMVSVGLLIAVVGLVQAGMRGVELTDRISGLQSMYMTYAGLLALTTCATFALLFFSVRGWKRSVLVMVILLMSAAILLSLTRSALLGVMAGSLIILILKRPKAVFIVPVLLILTFLLAPESVQTRIASMADVTNSTNQERLLLWQSGLMIVADNLFTGVGQNCFPLVYPHYCSPHILEPSISHLHNNFLEIAAERGIPCLLAWIALWLYPLFIMGRAWNRGDVSTDHQKTLVAASIGAVIAFLTAGMFEYNFGDSEVQMLFYFLLGAGVGAALSHRTRSTNA